MPSIKAQLNVDLTGLRELVTNQASLLGKADQAIEGILKNSPDGIGDLALLLRGTALPNVSASGNAQAGFESFLQLVPTDVGTAIGPLGGALDAFVGSLNGRLSLQLTGSFALYNAIEKLLEMNWSLEANTNNLGVKASQPRSFQFASQRNATNPILDSIEQWRALLQQLPDPLTLSILLELAHDGLSAMPRHLYPLRYLPLIDELTDKLDTVQQWRTLNGQALAERLGDSTFQLRDYIERTMVTGGVGAISERIRLFTDDLHPEMFQSVATQFAQGLNQLADAIAQGNTAGLTDALSQLEAQKEILDQALEALEDPKMDEQKTALHRQMSTLGTQMEARMLEMIAGLNPPQDTAILNRLLVPLNDLLEQSSVGTLVGSIRELFDLIEEWLAKLNLEALSETANTIGAETEEAIQGLQNQLLQTTAELSGWMNDARKSLDDLPLQQIKTTVEQALLSFQQTLEERVNSVFGPVRQTLETGLSTVESLTMAFDPSIVVGQFTSIIEQLNGVLSGPQVLVPIQTVKGAIDGINNGMKNVSITTFSDPVINVIDTVEQALAIAGALPLTDSLKKDLEKALKTLKPVETIGALLDAISDTVRAQVEVHLLPTSVFSQFRVKFAALQTQIQEYAPSKFIGDNLLVPYNKVLDQLEAYDPNALLAPVVEALDSLHRQIERSANPAPLFVALEAPFNSAMEAIRQFKPGDLVSPLTQHLEQGVKALADSLPADEINAVFDQVQMVSNGVQNILEMSNALQTLLDDMLQKLSSFADADAQIESIANELTAKLQDASDFELLESGMVKVAEAIERTRSEALQQELFDAINQALQRTQTMDASGKLALLAAARQRFTPTLLAGMPASEGKIALQDFLSRLNPLSATYTGPTNVPTNWLSQLQSYLNLIPTAFEGWNDRFHGPNSPFKELVPDDFSPSAIRTLLGEALQKQILESFRPIFIAASRIHAFVAALLEETNQLLEAMEQQISGLAAAAQAVLSLRDAINGILQSLQNLDLSFIPQTIQATYEDLTSKLQALNPAVFKTQLDQVFQTLLNQLNLEKLLGIETLNQQYHRIIQHLRDGTSERKGLGQVLKDLENSFKPVEDLIFQIDISANIEAFFSGLLSLLDELDLELKRILDAYSSMYDAKMEVSGKVSVGIAA